MLVLVRDLIFATKITGTAKALNIAARLLRDPALLTQVGGARLMVDLNLEGAIPAAAAWKKVTGGAVLGFVSHVDSATIALAREAGLDRVMARSQFAALLPQLLGGVALESAE